MSTYSHSLQGLNHNPVDLVKQVAGHLLSPGALKVQTEITDRPLAAVNVVVVVLG